MEELCSRRDESFREGKTSPKQELGEEAVPDEAAGDGTGIEPAAKNEVGEAVCDLEAALAARERQYEELATQYARLRADFDNYRRRRRQEMEDLSSRAAEGLIRNLLPVLDNLSRALEAAQTSGGNGGLTEGVRLVQRGLMEILAAEGLEELPGVGASFDPRWHEAVEAEHSESGEEPVIVQVEYVKGYRLAGRVLRPAMVKVGPAPASEAE